MRKLRDPQQAIYRSIQSYSEEHGYPPSVREICEAVGLSSTATVHTHLKNMEQKGLLVRDPSKQRAIQIAGETAASEPAKNTIPLVGHVAAGTPILAVENVEDAFPLPQVLTHGKAGDELFMLRVEGESMLDAGIRSGDILVVSHDPSCEDGDIVVARVNGESATVKRIYREKDYIRLQPENALYEPICVPYADVEIAGRVIGLLRAMY